MRMASRLDRWWYKIFPPRRIKVGAIKEFAFNAYKTYNNDKGTFVDCPMKSGRRALLRLAEVKRPLDPGDMHLFSWEFFYYLDGKVGKETPHRSAFQSFP